MSFTLGDVVAILTFLGSLLGAVWYLRGYMDSEVSRIETQQNFNHVQSIERLSELRSLIVEIGSRGEVFKVQLKDHDRQLDRLDHEVFKANGLAR